MLTKSLLEYIKTFPRHFHKGEEKNVVESAIRSNHKEAIRDVLEFVRGVVSIGRGGNEKHPGD